MADRKNEQNPENEKNELKKPDPETLHKTDPQDNMKGPVSSTMQNIKENAEKSDREEPKEEEEE